MLFLPPALESFATECERATEVQHLQIQGKQHYCACRESSSFLELKAVCTQAVNISSVANKRQVLLVFNSSVALNVPSPGKRVSPLTILCTDSRVR